MGKTKTFDEKCDDQTVEEIVSDIKKSQLKMLQAKEKAFSILYYLKETGRFREAPGYKNSTFEMYFRGRLPGEYYSEYREWEKKIQRHSG